MSPRIARCPRAAAIEVLCQWQGGEEPLDGLLAAGLSGLAPRDRNLARAMLLGVLRQRGLIDWLLAALSTTPLPRLRPEILQALRLGAYQLLFLDRVPAAAAIHATVEAVKQLRQPRWLAGFVNGVLRNVARRGRELMDLAVGQAPPEARYNHPAWLIDRWRERYGEAGLTCICQSNQSPAGLCLRINTARISPADYAELLSSRQIPWRWGRYLPEALWLEEGGAVEELPGYREGYFWVQDEIAQMIPQLLRPCPPGDWLDACAGLGGKTAILAGMLPPEVSLVAVEPQARRQRLFAENAARLGISGVSLYAGDLAAFQAGPGGAFAAVLVDAPCSGLGVTGRHPDIRWQRRQGDLARYQARQLAILRQAAELVGSGGVLVYATCSTEPEENEEVVAGFLAGGRRFARESAAGSLPPAAQTLVDGEGLLRALPGGPTGDGFFAARLRRVDLG